MQKPKAPFLCLVVASFAAAPTVSQAADGADTVAVTAANPLKMARAAEIVAVPLGDVAKLATGIDTAKLVVVDAAGKPVESQLVDMDADGKPDELVFQADFAANEKKTFTVAAGTRKLAPAAAYRVYGRFVRERHDDFVWENDRVAHRMYGPDLETWKADPLTSSGIDVWAKRVRKLVVNEWYMTDDYHRDNGEGADLYSVGPTRGCGGLGIWAGGKLNLSRNFVHSRVLANGPIRLVFELTYAPWEAGGMRIGETKRVIVDAGKNLDRFESTFAAESAAGGGTHKNAPLSVAIGIAKHPGGKFEENRAAGWLRSWEPMKENAGNLGCAVIVPRGSATEIRETELDKLIIAKAQAGAPLRFYAGAGWDKSGDFADAAAWGKYVETFAQAAGAPIRVTLARTKVAAAKVGTGTSN